MSMDEIELRALAHQIASLPDKPDRCVRFFERSSTSNLILLGSDAQMACEQVFHTLSVLKTLSDERGQPRVEYLSLSRNQAEAWWQQLLFPSFGSGYEIQIYGYGDDARSSLKLLRSATPGNVRALQDEVMLQGDGNVQPVLAFLSLYTDRHLHVAYWDYGRQTLGMCDFMDDELYSSLEATMIQLGVTELVTVRGSISPVVELKAIEAAAERVQARWSEISPRSGAAKAASAQSTLTLSYLDRLLRDKTTIQAEKYAKDLRSLACLCSLIEHLDLMGDASLAHRLTLEHYNPKQYVHLDSTALSALHIFEEGPNTSGSGSLYRLLNHTVTAQGARCLRQWLRQPLTSEQHIHARLDMVQALVQVTGVLRTLRTEALGTWPDLTRLARKFERGRASLQDIVRAYQVVLSMPRLLVVLRALGPVNSTSDSPTDAGTPSPFASYIEQLEIATAECQPLVQLVETTIDLPATARHEYLICPHFNPQLQEIQAERQEAEAQMQPIVSKACQDLRLDQGKKLKLEKHSSYGHVLRVPRSEANALSKAGSKYLELGIQKSGILFTTVELKKLSERWREATERYATTQASLVKEIVTVVSTYAPVLERVSRLVGELDALAAFAFIASSSIHPYVRPDISDSHTRLHLVASRHPCVEAQDGLHFIPNDVQMVRGERELLVITGPNMGGKSTYIRQVGLISLLAQIGCFVPCAQATLPIMDGLYARVGAGDAQARGISTFMAEMLEMASILRSATPRSLLLIDELGRGTSSSDGLGIAWALCEHMLAHVRAFTLFATHFHEVSHLARSWPTVVNLAVSTQLAPNGDITLLYKVIEGVGDQSFGLHVARVARFPEHVVKLAEAKATLLQHGKDLCLSAEDAARVKAVWARLKQAGAASEELLTELHAVKPLLRSALAGAGLLIDGVVGAPDPMSVEV